MKTVKILFVALFMLGASSVFAQQKFAVVDAQQIMISMPEFDSVKVKMEKIQQDLMDEMQANEKEYTNKIQEYTKSKDNYSEAIRAQKEKEIQSLMTRIEEFQQVAQKEVQDQNEKLMAPVREKLVNAIKSVGKANEFVFIFDKNSALYTSETLVTDATTMVKTHLNLK
ncbi:MAG: OmpH family outer membrane protein [Mucinivorans sp.]